MRKNGQLQKRLLASQNWVSSTVFAPLLHINNSALATVALLDSPISQNVSEDGRSHAEPNSFNESTVRSINAVAAHVQFIEEARTIVTNEMESMVVTGLATLVRKLFFHSGLQSNIFLFSIRISHFSLLLFKLHITSACCLISYRNYYMISPRPSRSEFVAHLTCQRYLRML